MSNTACLKTECISLLITSNLRIIKTKDMKTAVDRFLMATETIKMVRNALFDLAESKSLNVSDRLATIAYVLSGAEDILNEFEEDPESDNVLIFKN